MSVFTHVDRAELVAFLDNYALGGLLGFEGIEEGIENTNYFVDTEAGRFVLTLFERTDYESLPYFLGVMDHLARSGVATPLPALSRSGEILGELNGRPAALVQRLSGRGVTHPNSTQCANAAAAMARMHLSGRTYPGQREPCRGPRWWHAAAEQLRVHLDADALRLLDDEIAAQARFDDTALPRGVIHADLFRDNALFDGDVLAGFIDFYYACNDCWVYDLAVMVNDWTLNAGGALDDAAYAALIDAYAGERKPTSAERGAWQMKLRAGALRFWVSRLLDWHFPRAGELTYRKDPAEFRQLLEFHRGHALEL